MRRIYLVLVFSMLSVLALAQTLSPAPTAVPASIPLPPVAAYVPPSWLTDILTWLQSIPKVGPIVVLVLTALSVLATVMTVVSTALLGIKQAIQGVAQLAGAVKVIDWIEGVYQAVAPYVQFFSVYNVQKKDPPKA